MLYDLSMLRSVMGQMFPPASKFTEADVPDLSGRVLIVTGSNTGIGKEMARILLEHNARVYMACRSEDKTQAAIEELKEKTGKNDAFSLKLDLASFASIRKAAEVFLSKETRLDTLFNNAGVMAPPLDQLTEEGYDMQFGTNVVGHFLFATLLMPLLQRTAQEHGEARIVNTSSLGHVAAPKPCIDWDTLKPGEDGSSGDNKRRQMGPDTLYYQSKCGSIILANEWARRFGEQGIIATALHPGTIKSELGRHWPWHRKVAMGLVVRLTSTEIGAITAIYAGTSPEGKELNGKYFIPWARVGEPRKDLLDEQLGEKLWNWLQDQIAAP